VDYPRALHPLSPFPYSLSAGPRSLSGGSLFPVPYSLFPNSLR
jgi:hypothetical protein